MIIKLIKKIPFPTASFKLYPFMLSSSAKSPRPSLPKKKKLKIEYEEHEEEKKEVKKEE